MEDTWKLDIARVLSAPSRSPRAARRKDGVWCNDYVERRWSELTSEQPYAVHLASDGDYWTLGLDVDCDDPGESGRQVRKLTGRLDAAGLRWVLASSGTGGRRHVWVTLGEAVPAAQMAVVARALKTLARALDIGMLINPVTGALRPPGSAHRTGGHALIIGNRGEALRTLRRRNTAESWGRLLGWAQTVVAVSPAVGTGVPVADLPTRGGSPYLPGVRGALRGATRTRLRTGDLGATDRSATAAAVTAALVQAHLSIDDYRVLVRDPRCRGLAHLRTERRGGGFTARRDVDGAARRMWVQAIKFVLARPAAREADPVDPAELAGVHQVLAAVRAVGWGGQAGPTGRAVMDALLDVAVRQGRREVAASARWLAEATGASSSACADTLLRLTRDGWLRRAEGSPQAAHARSYVLQVPDGMAPTCGDGVDRTHAPAPPRLLPHPSSRGPTTP